MSKIVNAGDRTVISPEMDVVASMADGFKQELLAAITDSKGEVVLDLNGVEMVDSVGIGVIIASYNTLHQDRRQLRLVNVSRDVYGLFSAMRLNQRFVIEKKED